MSSKEHSVYPPPQSSHKNTSHQEKWRKFVRQSFRFMTAIFRDYIKVDLNHFIYL